MRFHAYDIEKREGRWGVVVPVADLFVPCNSKSDALALSVDMTARLIQQAEHDNHSRDGKFVNAHGQPIEFWDPWGQ